MRWKIIVAALAATLTMLVGTVGPAGAATSKRFVGFDQVHDGYPKSNSNAKHWFREDTRVGGGVTLTDAFGGPEGFGNGALALTTNSKNAAKAQLINHEVSGELLSGFVSASYYTFESTDAQAPGGTGTPGTDNASYQLQIDLNGDLADNPTGDRVNLVYETYWNDTDEDPVAPGVWQYWDTTNGSWWSSKDITCGDFTLTAGAGGPPFSDPKTVGEACATAKIVGYGVNVGSYNPNHIVGVDGVAIATTNFDLATDFQPK